MSAFTGDDRYERVYNELPIDKKGDATMCTVLDQMLEDGLKEGMKEGQNKKMVEIINSIIKNTGKGEKEACSMAGVSLREFRKWKEVYSS